MPRGGLIRSGVANFRTQTGQLCSHSISQFGDTDITSVYTISCLVYRGSDFQMQGAPLVTRERELRCIVSHATTFVEKGDILRTVVDKDGVTVLDEARVRDIEDYDHWEYGRRFRQLILDVDLDG